MPEAAKSNGFDAEKLKRWIGEIDRHKADMLSKQGEYMKYCRDKREMINKVFELAGNDGVPKRALKAHLKMRDLQAKAEAVLEGLEEEDQESVELIREALGGLSDLPLGQAAVQKAEETQTQKNVKALKKGIKGIVGMPGADDEGEDPRPRFLKNKDGSGDQPQPPAAA
ncbi:hypothetical protein GGR16_002388 [Chelatococcus caeni]|uniref:Uncharacterized protein n=1 Tax=Chelatococcus caeni TaxID=1348468 RepID=A0A840C1I9_9HYPH|nr:hypothetical protein [Chelatococcus caeni]MBB4017359.1 hypothetical protein [Chelatococcus caeni]